MIRVERAIMKVPALLLFVTLVACFGESALSAQQPTGTISGLVTDVTGAPVSGAIIRAVSESTGVTRQASSTESGAFVIPLLPAGTYEVCAEAGGFYRVQQKGILLNANLVLTVNFVLEAGNLSETIIVQGRPGQIDSSTGTLRQVIEEQKVTELPIVDRNPTRLVLLAAGTADQSNPAVTFGGGEQARMTSLTTVSQVAYPGTLVISSGGGRSDAVHYVLDGGSNRDIYLNLNSPLPNPDALQEFVIQTNNLSAEHRSAGGGLVTVTTKAGSNNLHGSIFTYLRNDALNATPFFNNARGGGKDTLKRSQFGGTIGGPIVRDRLFAFASYQGLRIRKGATRTRYVVFTDAQRAGDFGDTSVTINPLSEALLEYIPRAANQETGELYLDKRQRESENQYLLRVDLATRRNQLFGKFFDSRYPKEMAPGAKGNIYKGIPGYDFTYTVVSAGLNSIMTGSTVNNLTFAFTDLQTVVIGASPVGMNDLNPQVAGIREINVNFGGNISRINFLQRDRQIRRRSWQITDGAHWVRGKIDLAFGAELSQSNLHHVSHYRQAGFYTFEGPQEFMTGKLRRLIQGGGEFTDKMSWGGSLYASSNVRLSNRLNLSLGVRWDPFDPPSDKDRKVTCFVTGAKSLRFPNAPMGILFGGESGCPAAGFRRSWANFAPRIGFAYDVGGRARTVIRGGIGLAYQPPYLQALNNLVANPPFSPQVAISNTQFDDPYGFKGIPNPFPERFGPRAGSADDIFNLPAIVSSYELNWNPPRAWNYNLTMEHQFFTDMVMRAAYIGARGGMLGFNTDVNFPATVDELAKGARPNPEFGKMTQNQSRGSSSYNAFQIGVSKRFAKSIAFDAYYTWSKSIDAVSSISDVDELNVFNPLDPLGYRAVSDFDLRHRFVSNFMWELPNPAINGFWGFLVSGWQASGICSAQTGAPFSVVSNNNISDDYEINRSQVLATLTGQPGLTAGPKTLRIEKWFTTEAFAATPDNSFGTAPRNVLTGPGQFTFDLALSKQIAIKDGIQLQYRAEFFNAFNRTNFHLPDNNAGRAALPNPEFGRITGSLDPRTIQMALKLRF